MKDPNAFKFYRYNPSLPAAIIFIVSFGLTTALHGLQMFRHRSWFLIPLFIGGIFEAVGYVGRALAAQETPDWTLGPYIMQTLLLLIAPALFAASIYMILGKIILYTDGEKVSLIKKRWLTKIFVTGDVLSFFMQSGGGGLMASKDASTNKIGQNVVLGGLFLQILFFTFFVIVAVVFHTRMNRRPTEKSLNNPRWKIHLWVLYATSSLILIRSAFRIAEYIQGNAGYLLRNEVFLYVFDGTLMLIVLIIMNAVHPHELKLQKRDMEFQEVELKK